MKRFFSLLCLAAVATAAEVPSVIHTRDGKVYEGVVSVAKEDGGIIAISHGSGVKRLQPGELAPEAQKALGLPVTGEREAALSAMGKIETLDGKSYEQIRSVRLKPSFISFVHRDGATSVRFEKLPDSIRILCGYDPAVAAAFDKALAEHEKAMAEAEADAEKRIARATEKAENRKKREQALMMLQYTNYGDLNYWGGSIQARALQDAVVARTLQEGGYSPAESAVIMDRLRFR